MHTNETTPKFTRRTLRVGPTAAKTGMSEATIWRRVQMEDFPQPFHLTPGVTVWYEDEIDTWLAVKAAARAGVIAA